MSKAKRSAQYEVVNFEGLTMKIFGKDFQGAKDYAKKNEDSGIWYGLSVKRYYVIPSCRTCKCMPCECDDPNTPF